MTAVSPRENLVDDPLPGEPLTDFGMARRLVALHGDRLRYVRPWRRWLVWDGCRWAPDVDGAAERAGKATGRLLQVAAALGSSDRRKAMRRAADRAESAVGTRAILEQACTELELGVTPDQLDADPFLLNCRNGTLDLRTYELHPHDPADLLTKVTRAAYDPAASCTDFDRFLEQVQPDVAMREFLQRMLGHTISGQVVEHLLAVLAGRGANGKSTLTDVVLEALGDYACTTDPDLLIDTGTSHPTGVADLMGRRLAITHETDRGRRLAEGTVKRLTGGDRVKARWMRGDFFEFTPSHSVVLATNHRPDVRGDDEGIWRRLCLVPFDVVVPEDRRDARLPDRLRLELDGILNWLVAGYKAWNTDGLQPPEAVLDATKAYRADSDPIARWITDRCLTSPRHHTPAAALWRSWINWCHQQGIDPGTQTALGRALTDRGHTTIRGATIRRRGIALYTPDEETNQ